MARVIMIQGTMSNAGKSILVAGLCRIFKQDGYHVVPFKSQNMALNSYITSDGLEMGRAQVMQAEAAGVKPSVSMNPILLKPTNDVGSQVIVNGKVIGNMPAKEYFSYKKQLIPSIKEAFEKLNQEADIIVIEGAGSPAEINLKENDIVNMGLAHMVDAPVLLVGDIDRGGVFAQLLGTIMLLEEEEKRRIKGLVINKFRGDKTILNPGIVMLEEKSKIPVIGTVPYMELAIEDEDSLSERLHRKEVGLIDIAVIRFPRISNFTDFTVLEQQSGTTVRYVISVADLGNPDMIILPGSKNTMGDLKWMRQNGLEAIIKRKAALDVPIFGICGGYQMLGMTISDPHHVEEGGTIQGMELLNGYTILQEEKTRKQVQGHFAKLDGIFHELSQMEIRGYEIHMGQTTCEPGKELVDLQWSGQNLGDRQQNGYTEDGMMDSEGNRIDGMQSNHIYGSYVHGIFDAGNIAKYVVEALARKKGVELENMKYFNYDVFKEREYDKLAEQLREALDMDYIYQILSEAHVERGI